MQRRTHPVALPFTVGFTPCLKDLMSRDDAVAGLEGLERKLAASAKADQPAAVAEPADWQQQLRSLVQAGIPMVKAVIQDLQGGDTQCSCLFVKLILSLQKTIASSLDSMIC